jgi:hypothetical protein
MNNDNQIYTLPPQDKPLTTDDVQALIDSNLRNLNNTSKVSGGMLQSANFVSGSTGWQLTSTGAQINGGVSVQSLNIPDQTTVNSLHIDSSGNTWWGANVATGYAGSNAYILNTGAATFKNVSIGGTTVQYVITNSGIFSYGDNADGTATCDGSTAVAGMTRSGSTYTMTRDVYFNNLTVNNTVTLLPNGYRIFIGGTLTVNGTIQRNGASGGNGIDGAGGNTSGLGGAGGSALGAGYLSGTVVAGQGGDGQGVGSTQSTGRNGVNVLNSLGLNAVTGGVGAGGIAAGTPGVATPSNVALKVGIQLAQLLDVSSSGSTVKYIASASASGGGGGSSNAVDKGGAGGGGGGGQGGILAIYARSIIVGVTGVISSNGGAGGNGGNTGSVNAGVGGGGAGGNGGVLILTYNTYTNSGAVTVSAGAAGVKGTSGFSTSATDGTTGSVGAIYLFQLSL